MHGTQQPAPVTKHLFLTWCIEGECVSEVHKEAERTQSSPIAPRALLPSHTYLPTLLLLLLSTGQSLGALLFHCQAGDAPWPPSQPAERRAADMKWHTQECSRWTHHCHECRDSKTALEDKSSPGQISQLTNRRLIMKDGEQNHSMGSLMVWTPSQSEDQ